MERTQATKADSFSLAGFTPADPNGIEVRKKPLDMSKMKVADPGGIPVVETSQTMDAVKQNVRTYLKGLDDPESEEARMKVSQYLSSTLKIPYKSVYDTFDKTIERLFGRTMKPKKALQYLQDNFTAGNIQMKIVDIYTQIERTPGADHTIENDEIKRLRESMPPIDPYKHNILLDASGVAAQMIPYTWKVGKYAIPGAIATLAAGAITAPEGGAGAIPAAAATAKIVSSLVTIWGRAKSFTEGYKLANGIIFGDLMEMKDDKGNQINEDVARKISLAAGLPYAALEAIGAEYIISGNSVMRDIFRKMGTENIKKLLTKVSAKAITKLGIEGSFRQAANMMVRVGGAIAGKALETVALETLGEEIPQDLLEKEAQEIAKNITNELDGTEFVKAAPEEWADIIKNDLIEVTKGVLVMNAVRIFGAGVGAQRTYKNITKQSKLTQQEEQVTDFASTATPEEYDYLLETWLKEAEREGYKKVDTEIKEGRVSAKTQTGVNAGGLEFSVDKDTITINNIKLTDETQTDIARTMLQDLMNKYPDKQIKVSDKAEVLSRAVEDSDPVLGQYNKEIDKNVTQIRIEQENIGTLQETISNLEKEKRATIDTNEINVLDANIKDLEALVEESKAIIKLSQERVNNLKDQKALYTPKADRNIWEMTSGEYNKVVKFPAQKKGEYVNTIEGLRFKEIIQKNMPNMTEEEVNGAIKLVELAANARGMSTQSYIDKYFHPSIFSETESLKGKFAQDKKAAVEFLEDGKAILHVTELSDFSSWVHELAHVFRRTLTDKELKKAYRWARKETKGKLSEKLDFEESIYNETKGGAVKNKLKDRIENIKKSIATLDSGQWTKEMEETFAQGFERYIYEGETVHKSMRSIFQKFAKFMRAIYDTVAHKPEVTNEIRSVFDSLLSNERIDQLSGNQAESMDESMLFQSIDTEYKQNIIDAVEKGFDVPEKVLKQFTGEEWADKALREKKDNEKKVQDFGWLAEIARNSINKEDFMKEVEMYMGENVEQLDNLSKEWISNFYDYVSKSVTDINTGNKEWMEKLTNEYITGVIVDISKDINKAKSLGLPVSIIAQGNRYLSTKQVNPKQIELIRKTLRNNPTRYRRDISDVIGDVEEMRKVENELVYSRSIGVEDEYARPAPIVETSLSLADKIKDPDLRKRIVRGDITGREIYKLFNKISKHLESSDKRIAEIDKQMKINNAEEVARLNKINKLFKEKEAEIRALEKDKTKGEKEITRLRNKLEAEKDALKSAREEARLAVKNKNQQMKELRAEKKAVLDDYKASVKRRDDMRKLNEHTKALATHIMRRVPSSVYIDYRHMIEIIQAKLDPNFRSTKIVEERKFIKDFVKNNPEAKGIFSEKILSDVDKLSLHKITKEEMENGVIEYKDNEITLGELEQLRTYIDALVETGREVRRSKKRIERMITDSIKKDIAESLVKDKTLPPMDDAKTGEPRSIKDKALGYILTTYRPSRIADMLDGGTGRFNGPVHNFFIDGVNESYNAEIINKHRRYKAFNNKLGALGLKIDYFSKVYEVAGKKWSIDQIMDVYAGWKNEKKRAALRGGNHITEAIKDELISKLSEKDIEFADWIIDEYSENYERLRDAFQEHTNLDLGMEEFYTPIRRIAWAYTSDEMSVVEDLYERKGLKRATLDKGMTIKRKNIGEEHQNEIQLGLVSSWSSQVERQEHYINNATIVGRMNRIVQDRELKALAKATGKQPHWIEIQKYVARYTNPGIYKSMRGLDNLVKYLRNGTAMAYLSYNLLTMAKQLPSVLFYVAYSSPGDLLSGLFQTAFNYNKTRGIVESKDPQMIERSIDRYIEEMKQKDTSTYKHIINKIGLTGLKGIMMFDKVATTAGWIAVYNKAIRNGLSEAEAVRKARQATLHTQPAAAAKDIASIYAEDNFLSIFLQFTNQLNQNWNMLTYDAPTAILHGNIIHGIALYSALTLSATMFWMLAHRRLPEDKDDWNHIATDQLLNSIPVIGRTIAGARDGYDLNLPILTPVRVAGQTLSLSDKLIRGEKVSKEEAERYLKDMAEAIAISTHLPIMPEKRLYMGLKEKLPIQDIILGRKQE